MTEQHDFRLPIPDHQDPSGDVAVYDWQPGDMTRYSIAVCKLPEGSNLGGWGDRGPQHLIVHDVRGDSKEHNVAIVTTGARPYTFQRSGAKPYVSRILAAFASLVVFNDEDAARIYYSAARNDDSSFDHGCGVFR